MAKKTPKKTGAKKAPVKLIYIHASKDWGKGWLSEKKIANAIKRGEKINVKSKDGKDLIKNVKKAVNNPVFKQKIERSDFDRKKILSEIKSLDIDFYNSIKNNSDAELKAIIKTADNIKINVKDEDFEAISGIKIKGRKQRKEFYEKLYIDYQLRKKEFDNNVQLFMADFAEKNGINKDVVFMRTTQKGMFFYQTGNFIDRLKEEINGDKTTIDIIDFQGYKKKFKRHSEATKFLSELNSQINDILDIVNPKIKGKRQKEIYIRIMEIITTDINGEIKNITYDYSNLEIDASESDKLNFEQWFFEENGYEINPKKDIENI